MNVQISNSYNPSFQSTRLFSAKLKRVGENGQGKVCDAFVSLLDNSDVPIILKIKDYWHNTLGGGIISNFLCLQKNAQKREPLLTLLDILEKYKFLVVECSGEKRLNEGIAGIMEVFPSCNSLTIDKICTCNGFSDERKVDLKGVGRCLMFAACRIAEELEKFNISLRSVKNKNTLNFYEKLGMLHIEGDNSHFFRLDLPDFENFRLKISAGCDIRPLCDLGEKI